MFFKDATEFVVSSVGDISRVVGLVIK